MEVKADEGGVTYTRGGYRWCILPAGYLGSAFWGMVLVVASTNSITLRIAAALLLSALVVVLSIAKNISGFSEVFVLVTLTQMYGEVFSIYEDILHK